MGAEQARELPIPGRDLKGIHLAMEYLTQQNKRRCRQHYRRDHYGEGQAGGHHRRWRYRFRLSGHRPSAWLCRSSSIRTAAPNRLHNEGSPPHGHSGRCSFALRMRMKKAATANGAFRPPVHRPNGHVTKLHGQRVAFEKGAFIPVPNGDFELDADLSCLPWVLPDRLRMGCSTVWAWPMTRVDA